MVRIYKCTFCSRNMAVGTGLMYVKNDGTILRFCTSKCRKNMLELKRVPRRLKWSSTKAATPAKGTTSTKVATK